MLKTSDLSFPHNKTKSVTVCDVRPDDPYTRGTSPLLRPSFGITKNLKSMVNFNEAIE
jgi:hypothetical protein